MDASQLALIITSVSGAIAALAAAFTTVRKSEVDSLTRRVATLEADLEDERKAHAAEREAHAKTRSELAKAYDALRTAIEQRRAQQPANAQA